MPAFFALNSSRLPGDHYYKVVLNVVPKYGMAEPITIRWIVVGGVDAANGLLAVKKLIYDDKKLTWPNLKALAANFKGIRTYPEDVSRCTQAWK